MRLVDIKIADADDWIGIYVDDKLIWEGHPFYVISFDDFVLKPASKYCGGPVRVPSGDYAL